MNKIYYSDIDTAMNSGNFDRLIRQMKWSSYGDVMMVVGEMAEKLNEIMEYDEGEYHNDYDEGLEDMYARASNILDERASLLDEMPEDTVMTKSDVITIMDNLMDAMEHSRDNGY